LATDEQMDSADALSCSCCRGGLIKQFILTVLVFNCIFSFFFYCFSCSSSSWSSCHNCLNTLLSYGTIQPFYAGSAVKHQPTNQPTEVACCFTWIFVIVQTRMLWLLLCVVVATARPVAVPY